MSEEGRMEAGRRYFPTTGVEVWRNQGNGFFVFQLHYAANEIKRVPGYMDQTKAAMPLRKFKQEYEICWESYAGTPVYPDFQRKIHGSNEPLDAVLGLPLLRGWDFGLTPACVVAQYVNKQLRILREFTAVNKGAEQFSAEVMAQCRIQYPQFGAVGKYWKDVIDPSGAFRKDTDMGTCADVLRKHGIQPIPGPVSFEERRGAVEYFLTRVTKEGPNFLISLPDCPVTVRGFEGGYRYKESSLEVEPAKIRPIKDEHSHSQDCVQYLCALVKGLSKQRSGLQVPAFQYFRGDPRA